MEFPRDARPLVDACFQPCVELPPQLLQPQLIEPPEQNQKSNHARQAEPQGLVVRRSDGKIQERSGLVPHPAVIASDDVEAILPWTKIRIERLPSRAHVLP